MSNNRQGRGWAIVPDTEPPPGIASAGYEMGRKNPIEGSWLYSNELATNKTGIPFGLINGLMDGVWVGASNEAEFDLEIYHHLGNELSLTLLIPAFTVTFSPTSYNKTFAVADFGVINIPTDIQFAGKVVNIVTAPSDLKIYLRPSGDQP